MNKKDSIISLYKKGFKTVEIYKKINCSRQYVSLVLINNEIIKSKRIGKISTFCSGCAVTLNVYKSKQKKYYCSNDCKNLVSKQRSIYLKDKNKKYCSVCKNNFDYNLMLKNKNSYICRNCNNTRFKKYYRTKNGNKNIKNKAKELYNKYKYKSLARSKLNYSIKIGKTNRPKICENCKINDKRIEAHHKNYDKPLDVMWLCKPCHYKEDRLLTIITNKNKI